MPALLTLPVRSVLLASAVALAAVAPPADLRAREKVRRIAMTAADIPRTHGQPDRGFEGNRFTGIPMFDALPQIRQRNFVLDANDQPRVWPWQFSFAEGSPGLDRRVRQAANLCVNREELKQLPGGLMGVPKGTARRVIPGRATRPSTSGTTSPPPVA